MNSFEMAVAKAKEAEEAGNDIMAKIWAITAQKIAECSETTIEADEVDVDLSDIMDSAKKNYANCRNWNVFEIFKTKVRQRGCSHAQYEDAIRTIAEILCV